MVIQTSIFGNDSLPNKGSDPVTQGSSALWTWPVYQQMRLVMIWTIAIFFDIVCWNVPTFAKLIGTNMFQMINAWCCVGKEPFKVLERQMDFHVLDNEKFIDVTSFSTVQLLSNFLSSFVGFFVCLFAFGLFGLVFFFSIFGYTHSMWKFLGQWWSLCHSSDPSHSNDNTRSLTTRPPENSRLVKFLCRIRDEYL